jgi:hypothetical protein
MSIAKFNVVCCCLGLGKACFIVDSHAWTGEGHKKGMILFLFSPKASQLSQCLDPAMRNLNNHMYSVNWIFWGFLALRAWALPSRGHYPFTIALCNYPDIREADTLIENVKKFFTSAGADTPGL